MMPTGELDRKTVIHLSGSLAPRGNVYICNELETELSDVIGYAWLIIAFIPRNTE